MGTGSGTNRAATPAQQNAPVPVPISPRPRRATEAMHTRSATNRAETSTAGLHPAAVPTFDIPTEIQS